MGAVKPICLSSKKDTNLRPLGIRCTKRKKNLNWSRTDLQTNIIAHTPTETMCVFRQANGEKTSDLEIAFMT